MESIYKFKYERNGKIYVSKDMLPSKDDVFLIDRDVLEGKEEPKPTPGPVPHGEKKITKNGKYDVTTFASAEVNVPQGIFPSGHLKVTKNGKYDVSKFASTDVNVPTGIIPSGQLDIIENGVYDVTEKASINVEVPVGPAPEPIAKGSVIKLDEEYYKVLSVNEDLTDCEIMHIGPTTLSRYNTSQETVDFSVDGEIKKGLKYEGSLLDQACEAFYDALKADVKAAIIMQEVKQDMYDTNPAEGTEDFSIDNSAEGGMIYRFKKINDTPVTVSTRHAYAISCGAIKKYFGGTSANGVDVAKVFQLQGWFSDAYSGSSGRACFLDYSDNDGYNNRGGVRVHSGLLIYGYITMHCVCPAFHINLTKIKL